MKVIVIAVHPDDEVLGCGGTLLKHIAVGDEVHWCTITSYGDLDISEKKRESRHKELDRVYQMFQFENVHHLSFTATKLDTYSKGKIVNEISTIFETVKPEVVYLPFKDDIHSDHRITFEAAYSCTKSFRYPFIKKICMMEVLSETEFAPSLSSSSFIPNMFVDISSYMDKKIAIMNEYDGEFGDHPFPRSKKTVLAQATLRGAQAGCEAAEAFMILKEIM